MAHGKMKSVYGIYKKHGRAQFLDAAGYYSCHVHPESIDKTIDEMESRWYDATHRQTEAEKMVEDYNNGLTVLNDASLAYVDTGFGMKKNSVSVSYDEEKLSTLRLYLEQKGMQVEDELTKSLDTLYAKNVPAGVREFLNMRSGNAEPPAPKVRRQKTEPKPATEVTDHD